MNVRQSRIWIWIGVASATVAATAVLAAAAPPRFEISRFTIDGGGSMSNEARGLEVSGTIGQPDAGVMTGGGLTLTGGFWFEIPLGDCEEDGDVDLIDTYWFTRCLRGPDVGPPDPECLCFDVDRSRTIDLADLSIIQSSFTDS